MRLWYFIKRHIDEKFRNITGIFHVVHDIIFFGHLNYKTYITRDKMRKRYHLDDGIFEIQYSTNL